MQVKTQESDGYNAYQIGFGAKKEKRTSEGGQGVTLAKGWVAPLRASLKEVRTTRRACPRRTGGNSHV